VTIYCAQTLLTTLGAHPISERSMYKKTIKSQQRTSIISIADLMGIDFQELPLDQQRENLVAKWKSMVENPNIYKGQGQSIQVLQNAISAIRPKKKGHASVPHHFIDVCREQLNKFQFERIMTEASKRAEHDKNNE
jgi:hypothetical protein